MADYVFKITTPFTLDPSPINSEAPRASCMNVSRMFKAVAGGDYPGTCSVVADVATTTASATVTCASVQAADTVVVGGVTFTAVNGGSPTSVQFDMSGTDTATGANLAAAIAAHATTSTFCTASAASGVATITALQGGTIGNGITLTTSNGTRLAATGSGRLASGAQTRTTLSF